MAKNGNPNDGYASTPGRLRAPWNVQKKGCQVCLNCTLVECVEEYEPGDLRRLDCPLVRITSEARHEPETCRQ